MTANSQNEIPTFHATHVRQQAHERLQEAINCLQRNMIELECYVEKLDAAANDVQRAEIINAAINHLVTGIQPNLRIDLLARSQAELCKLGA
jgi:hypothetical protein